MPQVLANRDVAPPELAGGDSFRYTHAETAHVSKATDYYTWQSRIRDHRKANNLPAITSAQAEDQLCRQLPPEWCSHAENNRPWVKTRLSLGDIMAGAVAYAKLAVTGFKTVDQSEADRRARICAGCFLNVNAQGCGACGRMAELITGDVAQKKTAFDNALKACAACLCPNRSTVHFPMTILEQADPRDEKQPLFTDFCWRKKGGENYLPELAVA